MLLSLSVPRIVKMNMLCGLSSLKSMRVMNINFLVLIP